MAARLEARAALESCTKRVASLYLDLHQNGKGGSLRERAPGCPFVISALPHAVLERLDLLPSA